MNPKIYLRLKKAISILMDDGWWSLNIGDMIVLQKIGIITTELNELHQSTKYIKSDCYLTSAIEYRTYKSIKQLFNKNEETEYYMKWDDYESIDSLIRVSYGPPHYQSSKPLTYFEMLKTPVLIPFPKVTTMEDVFDDVSLQYNRDNKLNKILENG